MSGRALAGRWVAFLVLLVVSAAVGSEYAGLGPALLSLASLVVLVLACVGTVRFLLRRRKAAP